MPTFLVRERQKRRNAVVARKSITFGFSTNLTRAFIVFSSIIVEINEFWQLFDSSSRVDRCSIRIFIRIVLKKARVKLKQRVPDAVDGFIYLSLCLLYLICCLLYTRRLIFDMCFVRFRSVQELSALYLSRTMQRLDA